MRVAMRSAVASRSTCSCASVSRDRFSLAMRPKPVKRGNDAEAPTSQLQLLRRHGRAAKRLHEFVDLRLIGGVVLSIPRRVV